MWRLTFNFSQKLGGFALLFVLLVHAQQDDDQSGFISIDCGLADISSYSDSGTGINFISDAGFIDTGERRTVLNTDGWPQIRYKFVRSFPQGKRNCYRIKVTSGTKYLIRASFLYGNYDGQNKIPEFQLHLGPNLWDTVRLVYDVSNPTRMELIHYVPVVQNYIHVCLVNTSSGVPFISVLELRPLPNSTYSEQKNNSLALVRRGDTGGNGFIIRYPYDKHDRFWYDYSRTDWSQLNTSAEMIGSDYGSQPPSIIMKRAATPKNGTGSLDINLKDIFLEDNAKYHNYYHFAEVEKLPPNQSRLQYIYKDGELIHEPFALSYLETTTIYWRWSLTPNTTLSISKVDNSTLPPILNALEIYLEKEFSASETNQQDVDAITDIKSAYEIKRNWQGDPCVPQDYLWEGVSCSYENERPRIISLNLSSSGLTGEIPPSIFNLTMIQTMDLSNNNLTGSIPELFSQLSKLNTLNLEKNNLSGSIPGGLIERRKHGLSLSLCDNPNLSEQVSCKNKKHNINIIPIAGTIFGILILLSTVAAVLWGFKRKRKHEMIKNSIPNWSLESEGQQFTYSELVEITNNFASIIGIGGFGKVYHGTLRDEIEVAVKLLTSSSGSIEFQNEVKLLMRAHHRNLVSLIGYCCEGDTMALVFEYVTNGTLEQHISAAAENVLSWKERLQIAIDAARGLDYLHNGCKPPIVHRDLKTSNILLNERKQAKICDFGVSKVISKEGATHTRTDHIKGTFGYIDPEYFGTRILNKKSDIYSFGIVLLELITSRPAIITEIEPDVVHIRQWVSPKFEKLEIESIVYSKLQGTYNISSARKAIEIAMACAAPRAVQRPDITVVCIKLKECLEIEVPLEITKMPEIEESDDSTSHSSGSVLMMSHIEIETERHSN